MFLKNPYVLAPHTANFYGERGQIHKSAIIRPRIILHCW